MSDIFDKLDYLSETKSLIKNAIISAGGSVTDNTTFRNYAVAISEISPQTSIGYTPVEYDSSLDYLNETKKSIKSAISNKGVSIDDNTTFREYANKILQISPK